MANQKVFPQNWKSYGLIDIGDGERIERWGDYTIRRPFSLSNHAKNRDVGWERYDWRFDEASGQWQNNTDSPDSWVLEYEKLDLMFKVGPRSSKQLGLFPEQAANWDWMVERIKGSEIGGTLNILNLFAYSGGASLAALRAGDTVVTHVDSSTSANNLFRENLVLNNLAGDRVRVITEDAVKYIEREVKRGNKYEVIILDPPTFGTGGSNKWKLDKDLEALLHSLRELISDNFVCLILNIYSDINLRNIENILSTFGKLEHLQLCLSVETSKTVVRINDVYRVTSQNGEAS